jgi:hypothetical protein
MLLYGEFYAAGRDAGNYALQANLQTKLGQLGALELGFQNINRSPSYLYARKTAFPVIRTSSFNDENVTAINAGLFLNKLKARLTFSYFLQSNYTYFKDYRTVAQYAPLFNFVRAGISRETVLGKRWKWYLDLHVQTVAGCCSDSFASALYPQQIVIRSQALSQPCGRFWSRYALFQRILCRWILTPDGTVLLSGQA